GPGRHRRSDETLDAVDRIGSHARRCKRESWASALVAGRLRRSGKAFASGAATRQQFAERALSPGQSALRARAVAGSAFGLGKERPPLPDPLLQWRRGRTRRTCAFGRG